MVERWKAARFHGFGTLILLASRPTSKWMSHLWRLTTVLGQYSGASSGLWHYFSHSSELAILVSDCPTQVGRQKYAHFSP